MKLYADRPERAAAQILTDVLLLAWVLLWIWLGHEMHDLVTGLAEPGAKAEAAGRSLQGSLHDAGKSVSGIPLAGDRLREPFDRGAAAGRDLAEAAQSYQDAVGRLAVLVGVLVALVPILLAIGIWLPRRLAWVMAASAAMRLMAAGSGAEDLLALRALAARPLWRLAATATREGDLVDGWRQRNPAVVSRLARLELDELGLRLRR